MPINGSTPNCLEESDDLAKLLEFFNHHDDLLAELGAQQRHPDETGILVAVADDEAPELALQGQPRKELRLAADLQPKIIGPPGIQDLLHDLPELVDLDREDPAIIGVVIELGYGAAKGQVDRLDPVSKDVLKTNEHREFQPARLGLLDHIGQVHRRAGVPQRLGNRPSRFADVKVLGAPAMNVV